MGKEVQSTDKETAVGEGAWFMEKVTFLFPIILKKTFSRHPCLALELGHEICWAEWSIYLSWAAQRAGAKQLHRAILRLRLDSWTWLSWRQRIRFHHLALPVFVNTSPPPDIRQPATRYCSHSPLAPIYRHALAFPLYCLGGLAGVDLLCYILWSLPLGCGLAV